ncbi:MAG: LuxR C-terminal-related transcriptional regulator [Chloroflexota bacterium]
MNGTDVLTPREQDIFQLLSEGLSDQEIAQQLILAVGTVKWYNKQIYDKLQVRNRAEARQLARQNGLFRPSYAALPPASNLPAQITAFVGRKREQDDLKTLLASNRLLTITGMGGIGKTRLALQLAQSQLEAFSDGVFFIALAPLDPSENMLWAIARALHFEFGAATNSEQQLFHYLHDKNLLLVLDNFEHLLPSGHLVKTILHAGAKVKVLVTSRSRLGIYGECVYLLSGMTVPDAGQIDLNGENESLELFLHSARRVVPDFNPDAAQLEQINRICRLVDGSPLGIELAASWVETLTLDEIGHEIEKSLDFLDLQTADAPARQHSIRAAFDYSWGLLGGDEQTLFSALSVFKGGFTRDTAQAISGVDLPGLRRLVSKSLLLYEPESGRYYVHELLTQYAEEKLEFSGQADAIRDAHMDYFAAFMERITPDIKGRAQLAALEAVGGDFENIRRAWNRALLTRNAAQLERMLEPLYLFCFIRNRHQEGDEIFHAAQRAFAPPPGGKPSVLWGHILAHHLVHTPAIREQVEQSLQITRGYGVQKYVAFGLWTLSRAEIMAANLPRALELCEECLSDYDALDDSFWRARLLLQKSVIHNYLGHAPESLDFVEAAIHLSHQIGAVNIEAHALGNLGNIIRRRDNLPQAERLFHQAIALQEALHDYRMRAWNQGQLGVTAFLKGDFKRLAETSTLIAQARNVLADPEVQALSQLLKILTAMTVEDYSHCIQIAEPLVRHFNLYIALYSRLALAMAYCAHGDWDAARRFNREFIALQTEWGDDASAASALALEAVALTHEGHFEAAVEWLALAMTYPRTVGAWLKKWPPLIRLQAQLKTELGNEVYDAAWKRGQSLDLEAIVNGLLTHQ